MRSSARHGFLVANQGIVGDIFIPKYYDPDIEDELTALKRSHHLVQIGELIESGQLDMRQGNYVPKMHYGTGTTPYIRTSDFANWELRGSPKHGVSELVKQEYSLKQSVQPGDVLLVHEGTYLIGTACLLTDYDTDILYQHHLARLRVVDSDMLDGPLLMLALISPIAQRQIRSKQFTADIIDSIVGRLLEVYLPIPRNARHRQRLAALAFSAFTSRAAARLKLAVLRRELDSALAGVIDAAGLRESIASASGMKGAHGITGFLGSRYGFEAFKRRNIDIAGDILMPKYYDPSATESLAAMSGRCELVSIGELVKRGTISLETGDEVGKLAYGMGDIPFVRTSDLGNWELKHDPKQRVSAATYDMYAAKQSALAHDILLVRDGTYLVGTSSMVMPSDVPMLFSGGIYRIRVVDTDSLDPYLLLALLNTQVAGRQMRNKQFTRDVIDTLGRRLEEVVVPIPYDEELRSTVATMMRDLVESRAKLRTRIGELGRALAATPKHAATR
jgi:hypothetical protein